MSYTKNVHTCRAAVVAAFLLAVASIGRIDGSPTGAPPQACATMTPGHGFDAQPTSSSPFKTEIPAGENMLMDEIVRLELRNSVPNGLLSFKGYLVMAFDKNNATQPIGTFKLPSNGQLIDCIGGVKNAATHTSNSDKQLATVDWVPPKNFVGTVIFRTTFVQNVATYWVKTESIAVNFEMMTEPTVAPTVPSSASQPAVMWAALASVASLLAFVTL
ncbi:putative defense protein 3 [Daphnia pulicaria]|uniref:putative defense protein 3 n=1 Tax=Daphnia pulicaria TaxID=35523 RepID=UPI001EEAABBE|nr:putative defense protein 3 [Daphnia pulicaria]